MLTKHKNLNRFMGKHEDVRAALVNYIDQKRGMGESVHPTDCRRKLEMPLIPAVLPEKRRARDYP